MTRCNSNSSCGLSAPRALRILAFVASAACLLAPALRAQVVATYDFENGNAQNWVSFFNSSTPVSTSAAAYSGSSSLLTTTGSGATGGPSISLNNILVPGAKYTITGYMRLTSGEAPDTANFTMLRSD